MRTYILSFVMLAVASSAAPIFNQRDAPLLLVLPTAHSIEARAHGRPAGLAANIDNLVDGIKNILHSPQRRSLISQILTPEQIYGDIARREEARGLPAVVPALVDAGVSIISGIKSNIHSRNVNLLDDPDFDRHRLLYGVFAREHEERGLPALVPALVDAGVSIIGGIKSNVHSRSVPAIIRVGGELLGDFLKNNNDNTERGMALEEKRALSSIFPILPSQLEEALSVKAEGQTKRSLPAIIRVGGDLIGNYLSNNKQGDTMEERALALPGILSQFLRDPSLFSVNDDIE